MSKHAKKLQLSVHLAALQQEGKIVLNRILEKTEALAYEVIKMGLILHKGRHFHRHDSASARTADGTFAVSDDSFTLWAETNFPAISRASLYNYLRATERALVLQLGPDSLPNIHTYDDSIVDEMREAHLLHGVSLTELYKPLPAPGQGTNPGFAAAALNSLPADAPEIVAQQTWFHAWSITCQTAVDHREHLRHLPLHGDHDKKQVGLNDLKAQYLEVIKDINAAIKSKK